MQFERQGVKTAGINTGQYPLINNPQSLVMKCKLSDLFRTLFV